MRWRLIFVACALTACADAQSFKTLATFEKTVAAHPAGALVQGADGNLYGTTNLGGQPNDGTIFKVTPSGEITVLHEFRGGDGCFPMAGMVLAPDGNFYGTTHGKCADAQYGTVSKMTPSGTTSAIHLFDVTVFTGPVSKLAVGADGYLYGTTEGLSPAGVGAFGRIFRMLPSGGSFSTIFTFTIGNSSELIQGTDGNFYGSFGGLGAVAGPIDGGVFKVTPAGQMTVVAAFNRNTTGYDPVGGVVQEPDGNFYGTAMAGPVPSGMGTIYRATPAGAVTTLHTFTGVDGAFPKTTLLFATDGNFYGTTSTGGMNGGGTLFRLTPTGGFTVLQNFGGASGTNPQALMQASDGVIYGVTSGGGANDLGTVFKLAIAPPPPAQLDFGNALRVAQIADGGGWQTSFQIVNLDTVPVSYSIRFWDDGGNPLQLPLANGAPSGILQGGAAAFAETSGTADALSQGWAEIASSGRVAVLTIFRQRVSGRPDSEGTVAGAPSANHIFLPFDNTNGFVTGVALANSASSPVTVSMIFHLENGFEGNATLTLPPHAHKAFVLPADYPPLAAARGSVEFTAPTPDLTVVGLRFSPTFSFTSLGQFQ